MRRASSTSRIRSTWPRKSSGVSDRPALYSGYSSRRKVLRDTSKHTATCVGSSSRMRLMSMDVKPKTALVGWPVVVDISTSRSA